MSTKLALLSFEFEKLDDDIHYDSKLEHDFGRKQRPLPGEANQPVVAEAVARIKTCLAKSISSFFNFGSSQIQNHSNYLHTATLSYDVEVQHSDGSAGQTGIVVLIKFFLLQPTSVLRVSLDIEEMPSSLVSPESEHAYKSGFTNKRLERLAELLDESFKLNGRIECIPLIKRGRTERPHFLITSDERLLEYDFDRIMFHQKSEFQDVKIVSSPSLGNLLLLDNLQNLAEIDYDYTNALLDRQNVDYKNKEVLILGGGDGGVLYELLQEEPKFVTMAEIDPVVIEACRRYLKPCGEVLQKLEGPRHKIIIDDCMKVLRKSLQEGKKYDVILNDLTDIPVCKRQESLTAFEPNLKQQDNPWHFIEAIFNLSLACLADDGFYLNHATGRGNKASLAAYENFLLKSSVPVGYRSRMATVPSFMEIWVFYTVWKKQQGSDSDGENK